MRQKGNDRKMKEKEESEMPEKMKEKREGERETPEE